MTFKKTVLLTVLSMLGIGNTALADEDNVLYIDDFSVTAGKQTELSIKMKNTADIRGYEFELYLPEGMTFPKDEYGQYILTTSKDRAAKFEPASSIVAGDQNTKVLASNLLGIDITSGDGEILTITVAVDAAMTPGNYTITMKNIVLGTENTTVSYETEQVTSTVTVTEPLGYDVLLDEESTTVPEASSGAVTVLVKRAITANNWNTICLPFAMTEAQVKAAFGDDVELAEFDSYDLDDEDNPTEITVNFNDANLADDGLMDNYPYIIKVSADISEFTVDGVKIDPKEAEALTQFDNGKRGTNLKVFGKFIGTFHAQTEVPENCLFLSGNKFWYSTGSTTMKAFRAYFDFKTDILENPATARINIRTSSDTDGVQTLSAPASQDGRCYNLQGQVVGTPMRGLYIRDGKKYIVK